MKERFFSRRAVILVFLCTGQFGNAQIVSAQNDWTEQFEQYSSEDEQSDASSTEDFDQSHQSEQGTDDDLIISDDSRGDSSAGTDSSSGDSDTESDSSSDGLDETGIDGNLDTENSDALCFPRALFNLSEIAFAELLDETTAAAAVRAAVDAALEEGSWHEGSENTDWGTEDNDFCGLAESAGVIPKSFQELLAESQSESAGDSADGREGL